MKSQQIFHGRRSHRSAISIESKNYQREEEEEEEELNPRIKNRRTESITTTQNLN